MRTALEVIGALSVAAWALMAFALIVDRTEQRRRRWMDGRPTKEACLFGGRKAPTSEQEEPPCNE